MHALTHPPHYKQLRISRSYLCQSKWEYVLRVDSLGYKEERPEGSELFMPSYRKSEGKGEGWERRTGALWWSHPHENMWAGSKFLNIYVSFNIKNALISYSQVNLL